ncbi:MAG: ribosomal-protein-alanine N-acetyltransferase [Bradyrhizobium sp.]|nr:MAG: ribosomal-protein-alanine N-acetyltransferase [Bradyrhizobium sp.]
MFFRFRRPRPSTIRPLRIDAAEACAAIHRSGFAHPWSAAEFATLIASPTTLGSAALDPATGRLRGFALSRLAADEAEILTIAVDPSLRGRGVGADLLREHLTRAALSRARAIFLEVDPDNAAAVALYRRFGFRDVGRREGYYRLKDGQSASAIVMRKDLA